MRLPFIGISVGILGSGLVPTLPAPAWLWLSPFCLLLLFLRQPLWRLLGWALLGLFWGLLQGHWLLANVLPESVAGQEFRVRGQVVGLPQTDSRRQRFTLKVDAITPASGKALTVLPQRLQVSWYGGEPVTSGEVWQFKLRLRPPRGFVNPSAFDYQLWLLRRGIDAVGYVRDWEQNRRLAPASGLTLGYWRHKAAVWLEEAAPEPYKGRFQALLIGDRSALAQEDWRAMQATGTNHLIAISGLHVGFVAMLGFVLGSGLGRLASLAGATWPASRAGHCLALVLALDYSALAGFSLPTQRALLMVLAVQLGFLARRRVHPLDSWLGALALVLILDPLAGFDIGFWLSFTAVGALLLAFVGLRSLNRQALISLVKSQWLVFVGLLVPLSLLTGGASLLAPLANLLAIPLVTFLVVPWLLLSALFAGLWPALSDWLLMPATWGLWALDHWLTWLLSLDGPLLQLRPYWSWPALLMACLACLLLLLPAGLISRRIPYATLLLALLMPGPQPPALRLAFLDVGQGLAVAMQTPNHSLVYDTGPAYSDRLEAGSAILAPYLFKRGLSRLDALVLSHGHSDHAGGLEGLLSLIPAGKLWYGERPNRIPPGPDPKSCHQNRSWTWDGVRFQFLFAGLPAGANGNNQSCVLLIEHAGQSLLLTGDIEREVEWRLVGQNQLPDQLTLLQIPHHGSNSSSTPVWVERLKPELAVVSAGYRNHHQHPAPEVVERYQKAGSRLLHTGQLGALEFEWDQQGHRIERFYRQHQKRYWYNTKP